MSFFDDVYGVVKKIPKGKVMTYGEVAKAVGTRDARRVGQALHANKSKDVPCHRVVFADGRLAPNYAFGGAGEQKKRLVSEGVKFEGEQVILALVDS
jgi:methylated-DNA-protein-cysteine methyltransferase related protein